MFIMSKQYNGKPYVDLQVSVDFDYRRLLVGGRVSGVNTRFHWVYDLDEVLALPLKDVTLTVSVGGYLDGDGEARKVTRSFKARDLSDAKQLGYFEVPRGADPTKTYYYSHQGHAVYGNYVWFYEGEALSDAHPSLAFITVYDYNGKVVIPRTEVAALKDSDLMRKLGFTYDGSAEAESLKIKDGVLYLGFTGTAPLLPAPTASRTYSNTILINIQYGTSQTNQTQFQVLAVAGHHLFDDRLCDVLFRAEEFLLRDSDAPGCFPRSDKGSFRSHNVGRRYYLRYIEAHQWSHR